jgi:hypothetical protein
MILEWMPLREGAGYGSATQPILYDALLAEVFGHNVDQSNTPPGTYIFGGFLHQFSDPFAIDGGIRFGVSEHAASYGTTIG